MSWLDRLLGKNETSGQQAKQRLQMVLIHDRADLPPGLLEVIKDDFERHGEPEVNPVQALLLYNIADSELTAGELKSRGHYQGSNVSYNLKKLVEAGYVNHERSASDRRSVRVRLTPKGQAIRNRVDALYDRQMKAVEQVVGLNADELDRINKSLTRLERYWTDQVLYQL